MKRRFLLIILLTLSALLAVSIELKGQNSYKKIDSGKSRIVYDTIFIKFDSMLNTDRINIFSFVSDNNLLHLSHSISTGEINLYDSIGSILKNYDLNLPSKVKSSDCKFGLNSKYIFLTNDSIIGRIDLLTDSVLIRKRPDFYSKDGTLLIPEIHTMLADNIKIMNDSILILSLYNPYPIKYSRINSYPTLVKYDINNNTYEFLNIFYPKKYQKYEYCFYANMISCNGIWSNQIVYSFESSSEIYFYNSNLDKTTREVKVKSSLKDINTKSLGRLGSSYFKYNKDERYRHLLKSANYFRLIFNPFTNQYYRFIQGDIYAKGASGKYRTYKDKNTYFQVFDSQFNLIGEYLFPVRLSTTSSAFPTRDGFCISFGIDNENNSVLKFLQISIQN